MRSLVAIIPGLKSTTTSGERRFARRLEALLEDDYLCWYDVPIGRRCQHPNFVILHPRRGLLVIEVKDWKLDSIHRISTSSVSLWTQSGRKEVAHPLEQARQAKELLERDPALVAPAGQPYHGRRLSFPYGFGLVLANITRKQFDAHGLSNAIKPNLVICKDEMTESVDAEAFQALLWDMFPWSFGQALTMPQVDRIRAHLYPEIRISQSLLFPADETTPEQSADDALMQVMDLQQEQLARSTARAIASFTASPVRARR